MISRESRKRASSPARRGEHGVSSRLLDVEQEVVRATSGEHLAVLGAGGGGDGESSGARGSTGTTDSGFDAFVADFSKLTSGQAAASAARTPTSEPAAPAQQDLLGDLLGEEKKSYNPFI